MTHLDDLLDQALDDLSHDTPHDPALAGSVRHRLARRRALLYAPIAAAVAVLAIVGSILVIGQRDPTSTASGLPSSACVAVDEKPLPTWAVAGFSDPKTPQPYITSQSGSIIAILFGPLYAPPRAGYGNKILWVAAPAAGGGQLPPVGVDPSLKITGRLEGSDKTSSTVVEGGPGPSGVDVPAPGCWEFDLTWSGHHDTIALNYVNG